MVKSTTMTSCARHDDPIRSRFRDSGRTLRSFSWLDPQAPVFLPKLDGIFPLPSSTWESLDVLLARDVFGVKPLYTIRKTIVCMSAVKSDHCGTYARSIFSFRTSSDICPMELSATAKRLLQVQSELIPNTILTFWSGKNYQVCDHSRIRL